MGFEFGLAVIVIFSAIVAVEALPILNQKRRGLNIIAKNHNLAIGARNPKLKLYRSWRNR
jgi:hypothetical protein